MLIALLRAVKKQTKETTKKKTTDKKETRLEPRKKQIMKKFSAFDLCVIALFTSLTIVSAQVAIPLPGGVPFTLQTLVIPLTAAIAGPVLGTLTTALYLLLGAVGLPVFSGFSGGFAALIGPNAGFLWGFLPLAALTGLSYRLAAKTPHPQFTALLGTGMALALQLFAGSLVFAAVSHLSLRAANLVCVWPFIPTTIVKLILVLALARQLAPVFRKFALKSQLSQY